MTRKVEVVSYDPTWPAQFQIEADLLRTILGPEIVAIHHIGSTSIPGIKAKPIIDIILVVCDIERVDLYNEAMIACGFIPRGEYGLPERRFFPRDVDGVRTTHVHTWQSANHEITRHLAFRDYMIAHPADALAYGNLKAQLAEQFTYERERYISGKHDFIVEMERKAVAWYTAKGTL
jgi:GrpB-like predicted nucleotidyltransferase (UPF0157 family)